MQIPSQIPMSPTSRLATRPYHTQAAVMPGVPNEAPLHPPYVSPPAPQAGAWQHESPPTTPRLQVVLLTPGPFNLGSHEQCASLCAMLQPCCKLAVAVEPALAAAFLPQVYGCLHSTNS